MKDIAIFLAGAAVMLCAGGSVAYWLLFCDGWSFC